MRVCVQLFSYHTAHFLFPFRDVMSGNADLSFDVSCVISEYDSYTVLYFEL